jgi:hypothetical protein
MGILSDEDVIGDDDIRIEISNVANGNKEKVYERQKKRLNSWRKK